MCWKQLLVTEHFMEKEDKVMKWLHGRWMHSCGNKCLECELVWWIFKNQIERLINGESHDENLLSKRVIDSAANILIKNLHLHRLAVPLIHDGLSDEGSKNKTITKLRSSDIGNSILIEIKEIEGQLDYNHLEKLVPRWIQGALHGRCLHDLISNFF